MIYILWALMANNVHAGYMGEYDSLQSCQNAIVSRFEIENNLQNLDKTVFQKKLQKYMASQRDYICMPKNDQ